MELFDWFSINHKVYVIDFSSTSFARNWLAKVYMRSQQAKG